MSLTQSQRRFLSLYEYSYLIGSEPVSEKAARRAVGARDFDQYKITAAVGCKVTERGDYDVVTPTPTLLIFVAPMGFGVPRFDSAKPVQRGRKRQIPKGGRSEAGKPRARRRPGDKGKPALADSKVASTANSNRKPKKGNDAVTHPSASDMGAHTHRHLRRRHIVGDDGGKGIPA